MGLDAADNVLPEADKDSADAVDIDTVILNTGAEAFDVTLELVERAGGRNLLWRMNGSQA